MKHLSISQSFAIAGIAILGIFIALPVNYLPIVDKSWAMLLYYIIAMGIPCYISYRLFKNKIDTPTVTTSINDVKLVPFLSLVSITLLFGVIAPVSSLIPMPDSIKKALLETSSVMDVPSFLMMVIAAPIIEEIIFRGIILNGLLKKYSAPTAILMSSFLFGVVHLNPWQFMTAFIIGIFMGWVYKHTKNLLHTIVIHFSANLAGFLSRMLITDIDDIDSITSLAQYNSIQNIILYIIAPTCISILGILYIHKILNNSNKEASLV